MCGTLCGRRLFGNFDSDAMLVKLLIRDPYLQQLRDVCSLVILQSEAEMTDGCDHTHTHTCLPK